MTKKHLLLRTVFGLFAMMLCGRSSMVFSDSLAPLITHTKSADAREGQAITLQAVIIDNDDVDSAVVFFKTENMATFTSSPMRRSGNVFEAVIPQEEVLPPLFSYYIEARDKSGNLSYLPEGRSSAPFKVAVLPAMKPEVPLETPAAPKRKPTGNILLTLQNAVVSYPQGSNETTALDFISLQPGQIYTYNLNVSGLEGKNPYTFWLNREQELYTGRNFDRFRYITSIGDATITVGDFYATFSKLALDSVEVRGVSLKSTYKKDNFQIIYGRTFKATSESKKLSPVFLQMMTAVRKEFEGRRSLLGVNFLFNNDEEGSIPPTTKIAGTKNDVVSLDYKYSLRKKYYLLTELATGSGDKDDPNTTAVAQAPFSDSAYRLSVNYVTDTTQATFLYNRVGSDYLRGGTLESTMGNANDKRGFLFTVDSQPWDVMSFSAKWEKYRDNLNGALATGTTETNDKSLGIAYTPSSYFTLSGRLSNLDRTGGTTPSASKTRGLGMTYRTPGFSVFGSTTLLGNFQRITYDSAPVKLGINLWLFSLDSAFKDIFAFSTSYNATHTNEFTTVTNQQVKKDLKFGLTWNIIPFKFTAQTSYNYIRNLKTDNSINNHERNYGLTFNHYLTRTKIVSLGGRTIQYRDFASATQNSYNEYILLARYSQSF